MNRVIRVFVSSTFRDMIEDRNQLMSHVWPTLRKVCRERAVEFVEVDLRWGITEEQAQRKETLRYCLAEIKRCRPYFIGLLGERYGWVPNQEAYSQTLLDEEGWLKNYVSQHSVTELEILHGMLNDTDMAGHAFFYFRDPAYAQVRGGDYLAEDPAKPTRQDVLKQKIRAACATKGIPLRENYADPVALAALVLADLTAAIDADFPSDQVPDLWANENRGHEAYAQSHRKPFYVRRDTDYIRLDTFALEGSDGCGLTVLGEPGGGKSALLANWIAHWRQTHPSDFVFQHFIGSSAMSAGYPALMGRLMMAIARWCDGDGTGEFDSEAEKIHATAEEIARVFPECIKRLSTRAKQKGVRAVIVLDALNQLEDSKHGRSLEWLPCRLSGELRLIVSTLPDDTFQALRTREWPTLYVESLTPKECADLVARYLKHFSRGLSAVRTKKIVGAVAASNPRYLLTLLDDLRVTGTNDHLDSQIEDYLKATNITALFDKILSRYENEYERDRTGLVREVLSLLWAARRGLTEPELLTALEPAGRKQLPAAIWSPLRYALDDCLADRNGVLTFAHEHLRVAVERRYVSDNCQARNLRLRLADLFEQQQFISDRQADELPWLLRKAKSRDRLRSCLLNIMQFLLIWQRDEHELFGYWTWLKEERPMGQFYIHAFEEWAKSKPGYDADLSAAANALALFLKNASLTAEAEVLIRRTVDIAELGYHSQIYATPSTNRMHRNTIAIAQNNLATLLMATNRLAEAESLLRQALWMGQTDYGETPPIVTRLSNLAQLLQRTKRLPEAESLLRRALAIDEASFGKEHPMVAVRLNNLAQLLKDANKLAEAESLLRHALQIVEKSYGKAHPKVASQRDNLSALLRASNRHAEAESLNPRSSEMELMRWLESRTPPY